MGASRRKQSDKAIEAHRRKVDELIKRFQKIVPPDSDVWKKLDDMYDENGLPK
jgi:hypothetical protein